MTVLVTTPNGKVGSELVKLLQQAKVPFRLGAHTVEKAKAQFPGADVVRLDYDDAATLEAAVNGVTAVYLASPGDFPSAPEKRLLDAAKKAGVKRAVKLSAIGVDAASDDVPLRQTEKALLASGLEYTIVRPNWFFQNFSTSGAGGVQAGVIAEPAADAKTAFIDARDIAEVFFVALTTDRLVNRELTITGSESLSRSDVAAIFTRELGRPVRYQPLTDAQFREAMKPYLTESYTGLLSTLFGYVRNGWTAQPLDTVQQVLGRPPRTFTQFVREHRALWS